jgi:uncharacterized protein YbaR (Trm112 family)
MLDPELLSILCCPETQQDLIEASSEQIEKINQAISSGELKTRGGTCVTEPIDGALIRADQKFCYYIREEIPDLLIEDSIPLSGVI